MELYLHSPNTPSWRGAQLKHRDNFAFTFFVFVYSFDCNCYLHFIITEKAEAENPVTD
jgi:hypothetical protein